MKDRRLLILITGLFLALAGAAWAETASTDIAATKSKKFGRPDREAMRAYHAKVLSIYDENGDGVLDETERAVLREDIQAGEFEPPPGRPHSAGRGGRRGPPPEIVAKYDADGDGVLSEEEHAALRADIESGALVLPEPPAGRGPHGPPPEESDSQG